MNKKLPRAACLNCGLETSRPEYKYCSNKCQGELKHTLLVKRIEAAGAVENIQQARSYFKEKFPHKCMICGISVWMGKFILLLYRPH